MAAKRTAPCRCALSRSGKLEQLGPFGHLVAGRVEQFLHHAIGGAAMVCSIFMASITARGWPLVTASPAFTANDTTLPGMGAVGARLGRSLARVGQQVDGRDLRSASGVNTWSTSPCG